MRNVFLLSFLSSLFGFWSHAGLFCFNPVQIFNCDTPYSVQGFHDGIALIDPAVNPESPEDQQNEKVVLILNNQSAFFSSFFPFFKKNNIAPNTTSKKYSRFDISCSVSDLDHKFEINRGLDSPGLAGRRFKDGIIVYPTTGGYVDYSKSFVFACCKQDTFFK